MPVPDVVEHGQGVRHVQGHGLLAEDRDPGVHPRPDQVRVGPGSRGDDQSVQPGGEERLHGGQELGTEPGGDGPRVVFGDVREPEPDVDALRIQDVVERGDVVGVHDADPPHADQSEDDVFHACAPVCSAGTVNAARKASRAA